MCSKPSWDAASLVHGQPPAPEPPPEEQAAAEGGDPVTPSSEGSSSSKARPQPPTGGQQGFIFSGQDKADNLLFQTYVRQRLADIQEQLPAPPGLRERAELSFLEDQVLQDGMPLQKRRLRDPLRGVDESEISYTNLPLLSRFVSESGAILPRKLTGVSARKQRRLGKALKRAHQLALLPRTWKLPKYRHASYADQYSRPERPAAATAPDDEFRDPPDVRYPNQWERTRGALDIDLSRLSRASPGLAPNKAKPLGGRR